MAYSNWGGEVRLNGEHRTDKEDVPPYGDVDVERAPAAARIFVNILKARESGKTPTEHERCHHAVLGDGPVRLCGYKCYPVLYVARGEAIERIDPIPGGYGAYDADSDPNLGVFTGELVIGDQAWAWRVELDDNRVELSLREPDGHEWTGVAGFEFGSGFDW